MQAVGTLVFVLWIAGLFFLDRDPRERTSKALWLPVVWTMIICSRSITQWLSLERAANFAERYTEGNPVEAAIYAALIAAGLLVLNFRTGKVREFFRSNQVLLFFVAYCALSVLWSVDPAVAFKRWFKGTGNLVMVLVILTDPNPTLAIKRLFSRVGFLLLPLSALLIFFFPSLGTMYDPPEKVTYYLGVTTQKNELGLLCMICGLGSLWAFAGAYADRALRGRSRHMLAHGIVLVLALSLIKLCDSMTSFSCLVIAGTLMLLVRRPGTAASPRNVHLLVGGAVALAVFAAFVDSSGVLLRLLGRNATLTGRTDIWKAVLSFHTNPLLGAGFESFWLGGRIERVAEILGYQGIAEAHNGYLETYINLGLIGLGLLLATLAVGYRRAVGAMRTHVHAGSLQVAFVTAGVIFGTSEAGFKSMSPMWFGILLAVIAVPGLQAPDRPRVLQPSSIRTAPPRPIRILR